MSILNIKRAVNCKPSLGSFKPSVATYILGNYVLAHMGMCTYVQDTYLTPLYIVDVVLEKHVAGYHDTNHATLS